MWELIYLDGAVLQLGQAGIPLTAAGTLYGSGTFTTLPFIHGRGFQWERHRERLRAGSQALGIWQEGADECLESALRELAHANSADCGLARVALVEGEGDLWKGGSSGPRLHRMIFMKPLLPPRTPARLGLSDWPVFSRSRLRGHKLVNYAEPWQALGESRRQGYQEALRLDELGRISGGCRCAVLWRRGEHVAHPALECGGVRSTTLEWAVDWLRAAGREVTAAEAMPQETKEADEVLLLSAGVGVRSVAEFEGRALPGDAGELAQELRREYAKALEELAQQP